jgi:hypothetical protein
MGASMNEWKQVFKLNRLYINQNGVYNLGMVQKKKKGWNIE